MTKQKMTEQAANYIYDVLVSTCGASIKIDNRNSFVLAALNSPEDLEYRFQGNLGFGGKVYLDRHTWRVSCYQEDETPERIKAIKAANFQLSVIKILTTNSHSESPQST